MSTIPNTEIKELKDLISNRFDRVDEELKRVKEDIKKLEIGQAKIEARLDEWKPSIAKISDLAEKVGELKNWRQIALIVISSFLAGTIGWLLRGGKL